MSNLTYSRTFQRAGHPALPEAAAKKERIIAANALALSGADLSAALEAEKGRYAIYRENLSNAYGGSGDPAETARIAIKHENQAAADRILRDAAEIDAGLEIAKLAAGIKAKDQPVTRAGARNIIELSENVSRVLRRNARRGVKEVSSPSTRGVDLAKIPAQLAEITKKFEAVRDCPEPFAEAAQRLTAEIARLRDKGRPSVTMDVEVVGDGAIQFPRIEWPERHSRIEFGKGAAGFDSQPDTLALLCWIHGKAIEDATLESLKGLYSRVGLSMTAEQKRKELAKLQIEMTRLQRAEAAFLWTHVEMTGGALPAWVRPAMSVQAALQIEFV